MKFSLTRNLAISSVIIAGTLLIRSSAYTPSNQDPTTIPGYHFRLTQLSGEAEVRELYSLLRTDLTFDIWDRCSDRAHVWSYQMSKARRINSGKVFLFYTATLKPNPSKPGTMIAVSNTGNPAGKSWTWHVAPYVATQDEMWVMEKFEYMTEPKRMSDWLKIQTNGAECQELTGSAADLEYTQQLCSPSLSPRGRCINPFKKIRVAEGGPKCFYRRVPMYNLYPTSVPDVDFLKIPEATDWRGTAYSACTYSMAGGKGARRDRCSTFVNNPMALLGTSWAPPPGYVPSNQETPADTIPRDSSGNIIEPEMVHGALERP